MRKQKVTYLLSFARFLSPILPSQGKEKALHLGHSADQKKMQAEQHLQIPIALETVPIELHPSGHQNDIR
jgi:hypothetical protein